MAKVFKGFMDEVGISFDIKYPTNCDVKFKKNIDAAINLPAILINSFQDCLYKNVTENRSY
jgi:hypothetical protein